MSKRKKNARIQSGVVARAASGAGAVIEAKNKTPAALAFFALVCLAFVPYLPALKAGFVWDDQYAVLNNPALIGWQGFKLIWFSTSRIPYEAHWWPLTYTALWLQSQIWGMNALGFHGVNVALHGCAALLIWRLAGRLGWPGAWLAAALFAVHPAHVEAAAWIIEIKGLLAAIFYLLAVDCFLSYETRRRAAWLGLATLATVAAMLSKSSAVTLPAGIAVLIWLRNGWLCRRDILALAPIGLAVAVMVALDMRAVSHSVLEMDVPTPALGVRIAKGFWAFWHYGFKLIWPAKLSVIYPQWPYALNDARAWLGLAAFAAVIAALWTLRRRIGRAPLACFVFYFIALAPTLGFVHFGFLNQTPYADRYQYLASAAPLCGAAGLTAWGLPRLKGGARSSAPIAAALVLILFACFTWSRAVLFQSKSALFRGAVAVSPHSPHALAGLGDGLNQDGRYAEAVPLLQSVLKMDPKLPGAHASLGYAAIRLNDLNLAGESLENAIRLNPDDVLARNNLASVLSRLGRWAEAQQVMEEAARIDPHNTYVVNGLGEIKMHLGDDRGAAELFRSRMAEGAVDSNILSNLAWILATSPDASLRDAPGALRLATRAVQYDAAEHPKHLNALAAAQLANGDAEKAASICERALALASQRGMAQETVDEILGVLQACRAGKPYVHPVKEKEKP